MDGEKKQDMTGRVTAALFDIGIPEHLDGFHYLRYRLVDMIVTDIADLMIYPL